MHACASSPFVYLKREVADTTGTRLFASLSGSITKHVKTTPSMASGLVDMSTARVVLCDKTVLGSSDLVQITGRVGSVGLQYRVAGLVSRGPTVRTAGETVTLGAVRERRNNETQ